MRQRVTQRKQKTLSQGSFIDTLKAICTRYYPRHAQPNYGVGQYIDRGKLKNARSFIPNDVQVYALIDTSVFNTNKVGLAICEDGIRWRNSRWSDYKFLPWDKFAAVNIVLRGEVGNAITIGPDTCSWIGGDRQVGLEQLREIQTLARKRKAK